MLIAIFWLSVAVIFGVYFGYPMIMYLLALVKPVRVNKDNITPTVSLIIPAYNEEKVIREKIENSLALDYPKEKMEIIVASDGSTDRTNQIVKEYEEEGVILSGVEKREGKRATLFKTVPKAKGEIIIFSDADAILQKDAVKKLVRNFNDERVGCVDCVRIDANPEGVVADSIYWKYETLLKKLESRSGSLLGATGALFGIRKDLYSPIDKDRGDDFDLAVRVVQKGFYVVLEPEAVAFHRWLRNEEEFYRLVRIVSWYLPIVLLLLKDSLKLLKIRLAFQLLFHKMLRWFVPFFLGMAFVSNLFLLTQAYIYILVGQMLFYCLAAIGYGFERRGWRLPMILKIPYYFCLMNYASIVGIYRAIRREPITQWVKAAR